MIRISSNSGAQALAVAALVATLSGCAALVPDTGAVPAAAIEAREPVAAFELEGRMAAADGERAASGPVHWVHSPTGDQWTLFSPLGQIVGQLVSTPSGAIALTADGRRITGDNVETLLPELLGLPAPVRGLAHWVQAAPREGATVLQRDRFGRPARISDAGWIVDYHEYADEDPLAPPRRIDASWGEARIRLIIDQWIPRP